MSKNIKKLIKPKKLKKKLKKLNNKTKPIKLINILKKPTGSVYKLKTEKPNRTRTEKNQKKPSQTGKKTEPNRAKSKKLS